MPLLAPFANRLDQTAFYANGKKYNFDVELGNVRGPIPGTGFVNRAPQDWQLVEFKADAQGAWVTCKLDFYKNPIYMKQWPFAHTITMTYRVSNGRARSAHAARQPEHRADAGRDRLSPDLRAARRQPRMTGRCRWTRRRTGSKSRSGLPTGETQPIENFFGSDRTAIQLKKYALIDDVFTDLVRDANGRATMKLMYNGKELHAILGPKYKTVLAWSTALPAGGGARRRCWRVGGAAGGGGAAARARRLAARAPARRGTRRPPVRIPWIRRRA